MAAVFKGSLNLDKITGIRHDKGQRMTNVPVKREEKLPTPTRARNNNSILTRDGLKK